MAFFPQYGAMPMMPMMPMPVADREASDYTPAVVDLVLKGADHADYSKKSDQIKTIRDSVPAAVAKVAEVKEGNVKVGRIDETGGKLQVTVVILPGAEEGDFKPKTAAEKVVKGAKETDSELKIKICEWDDKENKKKDDKEEAVTAAVSASCQKPKCSLCHAAEGTKQYCQAIFDEMDEKAIKAKDDYEDAVAKYKDAVADANEVQDELAVLAKNKLELEELKKEAQRVRGDVKSIESALKEVDAQIKKKETAVCEKNGVVSKKEEGDDGVTKKRSTWLDAKKEAAKAATELAEAEKDVAELRADAGECMDCSLETYACSKGCTFQGRYSVVAKHEETCGVFACDYNCGFSSDFNSVKKHEFSCPAKRAGVAATQGTVMFPNRYF